MTQPAPAARPFSVRLGLYATPADAARLAKACARQLAGGPLPHRLSLRGGARLAAFYEELPAQWRAEHPGAGPGERAVHEIRVTLRAVPAGAEALAESLSRLLCPDPDHASPCPVPWSSAVLPED